MGAGARDLEGLRRCGSFLGAGVYGQFEARWFRAPKRTGKPKHWPGGTLRKSNSATALARNAWDAARRNRARSCEMAKARLPPSAGLPARIHGTAWRFYLRGIFSRSAENPFLINGLRCNTSRGIVLQSMFQGTQIIPMGCGGLQHGGRCNRERHTSVELPPFRSPRRPGRVEIGAAPGLAALPP